MKLLLVILVLLAVVPASAQDGDRAQPGSGKLFVSKKHSFAAQFPGDVETFEMEHASGPITGYSSVDEANFVIYRINVHRVVDLSKANTDATKKIIISGFFEQYTKESKAYNLKQKWVEHSQWPVLEYSFNQNGSLKEGVVSRKAGYVFIKDGGYYNVSLEGVESVKQLEQLSQRFFASIGLMGKSDLDKIDNQ